MTRDWRFELENRVYKLIVWFSIGHITLLLFALTIKRNGYIGEVVQKEQNKNTNSFEFVS